MVMAINTRVQMALQIVSLQNSCAYPGAEGKGDLSPALVPLH